MECKFEIKKFDDGWATVNIMGKDDKEEYCFSHLCKSLEEAQEFVNTHNAETELKRRVREWKRAIAEEDAMDDGKLHPVVNGYCVSKAGEQEEWEAF